MCWSSLTAANGCTLIDLEPLKHVVMAFAFFIRVLCMNCFLLFADQVLTFLGWKMTNCLVLADVLMIRKILYLVCFVSFRKKWGIRLNLVSRWFDVLRNSELSMVRKQKIRCLSGPLICGHPVLTRNPMPDQTLQYTIILNLVCFSVLTQCHDVPSWEDSPATRVNARK